MRFLAAVPLAVAAPSGSAYAGVEVFGLCLFGSCESDETTPTQLIDPKRYDVVFSVSDGVGEGVEEAAKAASELWRGRESPVGGSSGLVARAKGDYRRILAALYDLGYYGGTISVTVNGRQAADLPQGVQLPETSEVRIDVVAGPRYTFANVSVVNKAPPPSSKKDLVRDPAEIGLRTGEPARADVIRRANALAIEAWRQQGYPKARLADQAITARHPTDQIDARLSMAPGPKAAYGQVTVSGTQRMDPEFVEYMAGLEKGREYDPDDLAKANKRLERLGVFSTKRVVEGEQVRRDGHLPLHIIVREKKSRRLGVGISAASVDGLGIDAYWMHRNLFGKAERLRIYGKVNSPDNGFTTDNIEYRAGATFTKPGVFNPDTDLVADLFAMRESTETYEGPSAGGSLMFNNFLSDEITLTGGLFAVYSNFTDVFGEREFLSTGLLGTMVYDNRDSKIEPTKGIYGRLEARPYYEWKYTNFAGRFEGEVRSYLATARGRTVLAGRLRTGSLFGPSITQTPSNLLFTAGGGNSVRGYAYKSIGVEGPGSTVVGGRSLLEGSVELRQRIGTSFGLVGFVDAGTVSAESVVDFSEPFKVGAGLGLRYYTGLGAIRLDVAVPLDPAPSDSDFSLYVGIGQAF